jgi:hypothetical protein
VQQMRSHVFLLHEHFHHFHGFGTALVLRCMCVDVVDGGVCRDGGDRVEKKKVCMCVVVVCGKRSAW